MSDIEWKIIYIGVALIAGYIWAEFKLDKEKKQLLLMRSETQVQGYVPFVDGGFIMEKALDNLKELEKDKNYKLFIYTIKYGTISLVLFFILTIALIGGLTTGEDVCFSGPRYC